jgi:hypothetical protein
MLKARPARPVRRGSPAGSAGCGGRTPPPARPASELGAHLSSSSYLVTHRFGVFFKKVSAAPATPRPSRAPRGEAATIEVIANCLQRDMHFAGCDASPRHPHPCRIRIIAEAEGSAIESVNEGSLVCQTRGMLCWISALGNVRFLRTEDGGSGREAVAQRARPKLCAHTSDTEGWLARSTV